MRSIATVIVVGVVVLVLGGAATPWWLSSSGSGTGTEVELDESQVFIEFNSTDTDFGIQFFWDGEPWEYMNVYNTDGKKVLSVKTKKNLRDQGLTEGFFESAEPPASVLSMSAFLARFPAGTYEFEGRTQDGDDLVGDDDFTHVLPAPPVNFSPDDGDLVDPNLPLVLSFDAVTQDLDGTPLLPELYEVILETENGILRVFSIVLEGDVANPAVTVPPQFLKSGETYKFEVIVQEPSGNRTIAEIEFDTM